MVKASKIDPEGYRKTLDPIKRYDSETTKLSDGWLNEEREAKAKKDMIDEETWQKQQDRDAMQEPGYVMHVYDRNNGGYTRYEP